jgi:hypothetical protein
MEPDLFQGDRVRRIFRRAQELIRKQGIATPLGIQVKIGLIAIKVTKSPQQSDGQRTQHLATDRKFYPYRLEISQRNRLVMCVVYNDADEIQITTFRQGLWEYRVPSNQTRTELPNGPNQHGRSRGQTVRARDGGRRTRT